MRENIKDNLKIIEGGKTTIKINAQKAKMTSPIQRVLSEINKEKAKNKFSVRDLF